MIGLCIFTVIGAGLVWCHQQQQPLGAETFFHPDNAVTDSDFPANPAWRIGEVQTIRWTPTPDSDHAITLWQYSIKAGSALQGPPIFKGRAAIGTIQFDWVPQIYHFDLSESNVFYLRLLPGTGADQDQGMIEAPSMRSRYFNISIASSSPSPSLLSRALSAKTELDQTSPPTIAIAPSYTALTLDTAPPPPSVVPSRSSAPQATYVIAGASSSTATPDPLPTGAKIGIGVGAGVGGVALVVLGVMLTFRRARKRDSAMRLSTLKDLPILPRPGGGGGLEISHFYQLKEGYPSTVSTKGHHRQVTISETRLAYHPGVAELHG
ncbi:hypothetical protein PG994_005406 [Apiospora phragmitis]|uniref:Uncharacterized protein n=1 Tax=Apiospora phragmitis TaxID=2905665 RepID=A0ABR1VC64_9PEZI